MAFSGLKATFDAAAQQYTVARPGYPDKLVEAVIDYSRLPALPVVFGDSKGSRYGSGDSRDILEIGCGTGQATLPFAQRGYTILCLEPGPNLAAVAHERLNPFSRVAVETITFEDWPLRESAFDLVMSAQAFHWIDPEVGLAKAAQALKPAGALALFWNLAPQETADQPSDEPVATYPGATQSATALTELSGIIQRQYRIHAPELAHTQRAHPLEPQVTALEEQLRSRPDLFCNVQVMRFAWTERYDAARYVALLSTYSAHIALPDEQRQALFDGIARVIEEHQDGSLVKPYLSVLLLARKATGP